MNWKAFKINPFTAAAARHGGRLLCRDVESFIFCAATGRCGTTTLRSLLSEIPECSAHHEPHPQMFGETLRACNNGDDAPMKRMFWQRKVPNVYWAARNKRWYFESSYLFLLTCWHEAVKEFGSRMQVVNVRRDPDEVAASFYGREMEPLTDPWLPHPMEPRNVLDLREHLKEGAPFDHMYYRLLWYCYEVDARTIRFKNAYPRIPVHFITTQGLNDTTQVETLLANLGIPMTDTLRAAVGTQANQSPQKPERPNDISVSDLRHFHTLCQDALKKV